MKAVIPVAAKKESLFPFSESRPVGLMPVVGKPLVSHLISALQEVGVDDIYLVTNYMEEQFEEVFDEYTNVNLITQEELNGTAAAVNCCDFIDEEFFVVNGDVMVSQRDLESLLEKHNNSGDGVTLLATDQRKPEKFGVLSITNDRVKSIEEKPEEAENPLVNTGIYVFDPEIFDYIQRLENDYLSLTDAVAGMIGDSEGRFELIQDYWFDINSPRKLWEADKIKRDHDTRGVHGEADISENAEVGDNVVIEKGAEVRPGSVIEGSYIGENAVIGPNTVVKGSTVSRNSDLEECSVSNSLLFERTALKAFTSIEQCILGEEVEVEPGTVIRESFIGPRSFIEMNNSIRNVEFVPDARTDLGEISK